MRETLFKLCPFCWKYRYTYISTSFRMWASFFMINRCIYYSIYIKTTCSIHRNISYPSYYSKYTKTTLKIWQSKVPLSNFKCTNPIKIQWHFKKTYKKKSYFLLKSQLQLKNMRLIWKLCFFHVAYNLGEFNWHTDRLSWQPGIGWLFCVCNVAMETGLFCLLPSNILYLFSLQ